MQISDTVLRKRGVHAWEAPSEQLLAGPGVILEQSLHGNSRVQNKKPRRPWPCSARGCFSTRLTTSPGAFCVWLVAENEGRGGVGVGGFKGGWINSSGSQLLGSFQRKFLPASFHGMKKSPERSLFHPGLHPTDRDTRWKAPGTESTGLGRGRGPVRGHTRTQRPAGSTS